MISLWQPMTVAEFADFERILDPQIISANGNHWRRVRPFFFRPILPYREYSANSLRPPWQCTIGGFQHALPTETGSNSILACLLFQDVPIYSLNSLDYNRKRQVKIAAKNFTIRPMTDVAEFKNKAYPVYLSFYQRTQYQYGADRCARPFFEKWADSLFAAPKALVLGAWKDDCLGGVSISQLVEDTLHYSTFFCDEESLRLNVSDLMLHFIRENIAGYPGVTSVFAGMYKGGNGLDSFYLLRGGKLVRKPAALHLSPMAKVCLQYLLSRQYALLQGKPENVAAQGAA